MERTEFSLYDYVLFVIMLLLSVLIGIYFGCFGKKQSSANEYLLGGKAMKVFPIAMSLVASQISGITLLAIPADTYKFGSNFSMMVISVVIDCVLSAYIFVPVFYKLKITSTYEYLQMRFDTRLRIMGSILYTIAMIIYLPIVVYLPALAFSQVTSVNIHLVNPLICIICIFYTSIGGIKAVVWTDTLQFSAMLGAIVVVLYMGVSSVGGIGTVWQRSYEGKRLEIDFDVDPTKRDTFWAIVIGWTTNWLSHVAISQGQVQKYLSLPSLSDVRKAILIFCIGFIFCKVASIFTGLIIYAKYFDCDPFLTKQVVHNDQLLPYYVMDVASKIPALPGLFIAGVFCASLSSLSACMNSLSGTIYEDFVARYMPRYIKQEKISNILKLIVVIIGFVSTCLVFVVERLGGMLPLSITLSGMSAGPLLGVFILGMMFPSANSKGALIGTISSMVVVSWIVIGGQIYKAQGLLTHTPKPVSVDGCPINSTFLEVESISSAEGNVFILFRITYYYYAMIGVIIVLIIGLPISWYTNKDNSIVDKDLISPVMHWAIPKNRKKGETTYHNVDEALRIITENHLVLEDKKNIDKI